MSAAEEAAKGAAAAATAETKEKPSLIDEMVASTRPQSPKEADRARDYFKQFLGQAVQPGQVVSKDAEQNIKYWIGEIDRKLSAQLNEIMHAPEFHRLKATSRGLNTLHNQTHTG